MVTDYAFILGKKYPRCQWYMDGDGYENLVWQDISSKPSKEELDAEYKDYYLNFSHLDDMKAELSHSLTDQLYMLWKAMDNGEIPKAHEFYDFVSCIHNKYPIKKGDEL